MPAAVITAVSLLSAPAVAQAQQPAAAGAGPLGTVTLITGDKVAVRGDRVAAVRMDPRRGTVRYWQYQRDGRDHVVPADAARLVAEGLVDERLFDVTGLVQQGYADDRSRELPLLLDSPPGARAAAPSVARTTKDLGGVGMLAVAVPKERATEFWDNVPAGKIWLDGRVRTSLDQSVAQTGAPQAWAAGHRADGVKVAVLDTGADPAHPDLAGKIDATANFTGDPDAKDGDGHGTHVASTIAGTGAASGGQFAGVAPGARLLVGKVLDNTGGGSESGLLAGMQWAVEQGARVVNMSLGGGPSDGSDPLSLAINELSDSSGALFVVAAGNRAGISTVSAPATADRALAVGSVTKSGQLSHFSASGPRPANFGLKPEITAPGSDIVAARAAGTLAEVSVNPSYAKLSGTSMASPHVAGAAAILAGQHPDWSAERLKAGLVGTAKPLAAGGIFSQGSGQVDVARAVGQQAVAEPPTLGLGNLGSIEPTEAPVTYTNTSDRPLSLNLSLDMRHLNGSAAPAGLFGLAEPRIVVPAKGSVEVPVRVTPGPGRTGQFAGTLVATGGQTAIRTPVAAALAGAYGDLTVRLDDRLGNPAVGLVMVQNMTTGEVRSDFAENGVNSLWLPAGKYRVLGQVAEGGWNFDGVTHYAAEVTVGAEPSEVRIEAAKGAPMTVSVDDPAARPDTANGINAVVSTLNTQNGPRTALAAFGGGPAYPMYSLGSAELPGISLTHVSQWQVPWTTVTVNGEYEIGFAIEQSREGWRGSESGPLVDIGDGTGELGDLTGKIPLFYADGLPQPEVSERLRLVKARGARIVLAHSYVADQSVLPIVQVFDADDIQRLRDELAQGPVRIKIDGRRDSPVSYHLTSTVDGRIPAGHAFRFEKAQLGRVDANFASLKETDDFSRLLMTAALPNLGVGMEVNTRWPQSRTDYYSPGATWQSRSAVGFDEQRFSLTGVEATSPYTPKAGEVSRQCLYCGPFGPELPQLQPDPQTGKPLPFAYREGDKLTFAVPMFGGTDPSTVAFPDFTNTGNTVLSRNGQQLGTNTMTGIGQFDVPGGLGRYTLSTTGAKNTPEWTFSPKTSAEWTFTSAPGKGKVALPLLDVRFGLPLDGFNSAAPGVVTGGVDVRVQQGAHQAPIRDLRVEVSYDDGGSWTSAKVFRDGGRFKVEIPAGVGFASLRATAQDVLGNSVTETMIKAYRAK